MTQDYINILVKQMSKIIDLKCIADRIIEVGGVDVAIKKDIDWVCNKWTVFKLIAHHLYVPLYTSIISKYFGEFYYVDLFSGSGFCVCNPDLVIAGSPLIALANAYKPWSKVYLNDSYSPRVHVLKKRVEVLASISKDPRRSKYGFPLSPIDVNSIEFSVADANEVVHKIMDEIEKRHEKLLANKRKGCHVYFFIDPFGFEFKLDSLKRILGSPVRSDIFLLVNVMGAVYQLRIKLKRASKGEPYNDEKLRAFLGDEIYIHVEQCSRKRGKSCDDLTVGEMRECIRDYIKQLFEEHNYVVEFIDLATPSKGHVFDLVFATRRTGKGNPYLNAIKYIKDVYITRGAKDNYVAIDKTVDYLRTGNIGLIKYIVKGFDKALEKSSIYKKFGSSR